MGRECKCGHSVGITHVKKNVASQVVGCQLISKTDGSAVTSGTTTVYVTGDGGTQAAGTVGAGACTHEGQGFWTYTPSQAETNYDHVAFTFVNSTACNATVQIYPSYPQTGDNYARLGGPAGASVSADVAAVKAQLATVNADTDDIQTRLPAALVGGRIDASVGAMAANVLTATAIAADAITDAKVAPDVTIASVTGSVGSIATGGINAGSFAAGAIDAAAIATDAIGAVELAGGAASEVATAVRAELGPELGRIDVATSSRASQASVDTLGGYVDTEVGAIKTVTDKLDTGLEPDGASGYQWTARALDNAPTGGGGGGGSPGAIANAVWTEAIADHSDVVGSTAEALANAAAAGNPWNAAIETGFTAGDIMRLLAAYAAGKTTIVKVGTKLHEITFRAIDDSNTRIASTVTDGERTALTLTLTPTP